MSDKNRIIYLSILIVCMVGIIILLCPKPEYKATFNLKQDFSIIENYVDIAFVENPNKIIDMASTSQNDSLIEEDIENSVIEETFKTEVTNRSEVNRTEWQTFVATAYCPCSKCCGKSTGITASGLPATPNHTIAMSATYPFGTKIEIEGYGIYVVEDRGGAIKGDRIDIFFSSHQEALNWGRKNIRARVIENE